MLNYQSSIKEDKLYSGLIIKEISFLRRSDILSDLNDGINAYYIDCNSSFLS